MIFITGASGKTGQAVIQALAKRGATIRAIVHHPHQIETVKAVGANEAFAVDLHDKEALLKTAQGAQGIYHICPNVNPDEIEIGQTVIDIARACSIQRVVYHSVLHPQVEAMPHHWLKMRVEEVLFESGLNWTILQPCAYMQNIMSGWQTIISEGIYYVPYHTKARLSIVDLKDVAEVAARVLLEEGHEYAIYELAGPQPLSQDEVAEILSRVLKRSVSARTLDRTLWKERAQAGSMSTYAIETLVKMFEYYEAFGFTGNPRVLSWLLGRPPATLEQFLNRQVAFS